MSLLSPSVHTPPRLSSIGTSTPKSGPPRWSEISRGVVTPVSRMTLSVRNQNAPFSSVKKILPVRLSACSFGSVSTPSSSSFRSSGSEEADTSKLLATSQYLASQAVQTACENNRLVDENMTLLGQKNELKIIIEDLSEELTAKTTEVAEKNVLIESLREDLAVARQRLEETEQQVEGLSATVEPLTKRVELLEAEKKALLDQNETMASELKKHAEHEGQVMGHQNHKQKISYLVKVKQDNAQLLQEVSKLQAEVNKLKRLGSRKEPPGPTKK